MIKQVGSIFRFGYCCYCLYITNIFIPGHRHRFILFKIRSVATFASQKKTNNNNIKIDQCIALFFSAQTQKQRENNRETTVFGMDRRIIAFNSWWHSILVFCSCTRTHNHMLWRRRLGRGDTGFVNRLKLKEVFYATIHWVNAVFRYCVYLLRKKNWNYWSSVLVWSLCAAKRVS